VHNIRFGSAPFSQEQATQIELVQKRAPACFGERGRISYSDAMKQPQINLEEKIDRLVGRRTKTPDALSTATSKKADSIAWRKELGGVRVPRGVYRFQSDAEADQWLWRMIARPTS